MCIETESASRASKRASKQHCLVDGYLPGGINTASKRRLVLVPELFCVAGYVNIFPMYSFSSQKQCWVVQYLHSFSIVFLATK